MSVGLWSINIEAAMTNSEHCRRIKPRMVEFAEPETWKPSQQNRVVVGEMTVMHGGPVGMRIPEHEHPEIQIGMHFVNRQIRGGLQREETTPAYFSLIPSGKSHTGGWEHGSEVLVTLFSRGQIEQAAGELLRSSRFEIVSAVCAVDPVFLAMGSVLRREFLSDGFTDPFFIEAVGTVIAGQIVRRWSSEPRQLSMKGRLSSAQIRKALDAIDEWMSSGIRISALAGELGMGTHQFTRLFRQTMGQSPYRFAMLRRIELARGLLEETALPLAEIALELGFVSQSHFTSAFNREVKTTPAAYRSSFQNASRRRFNS
jgi:AraC family transcriptional regulator